METGVEDSYNQWFLGVMKHIIKMMLIIQIHNWQQSTMHHITKANDKMLGVAMHCKQQKFN
jgi:hypothetical protein